MSPQEILTVGQDALGVMLAVGAPMLIAALVVGLAVSVVQAATQINEMTLSFIPKLLALVATLVVAGPWMLDTLVGYTRQLFLSIPNLVG
ncbi:MAG: flagellar biosynthesis protein FliQ [Burkholderiales bacterium]